MSLTNAEKCKKYYAKNRERLKQAVRDAYWADPSKARKSARASYVKHRVTRDATNARWHKENGVRYKELMRAARFKLKQEVIEAYGGKCVCCGEGELFFLTIDHIYNDGAEERRKGTGVNLYRKLRSAGYPKDRYQVLCFNCNCAKGFFGVCPHVARPS